MRKTPLHQPKVEKVSIWKLQCQKYIRIILIILLAFTSLHILGFYLWSLFYPFTPESISLKYAVYITIGCFFYLFVHKKAIDEWFGAKEVTLFEEQSKPAKKLK